MQNKKLLLGGVELKLKLIGDHLSFNMTLTLSPLTEFFLTHHWVNNQKDKNTVISFIK